MSGQHESLRKDSQQSTDVRSSVDVKPNVGAKPWEVDIMPDMFGYHLLVDGRRFFIPSERFSQVLTLMQYWAGKSVPITAQAKVQVEQGE